MMFERDVLDAKVRSADPKLLSSHLVRANAQNANNDSPMCANKIKHKKQMAGTQTCFCVYKVHSGTETELLVEL